jgi:hypothetical protein
MNFHTVPFDHRGEQFKKMIMIPHVLEDRPPLDPSRRHMVPSALNIHSYRSCHAAHCISPTRQLASFYLSLVLTTALTGRGCSNIVFLFNSLLFNDTKPPTINPVFKTY